MCVLIMAIIALCVTHLYMITITATVLILRTKTHKKGHRTIIIIADGRLFSFDQLCVPTTCVFTNLIVFKKKIADPPRGLNAPSPKPKCANITKHIRVHVAPKRIKNIITITDVNVPRYPWRTRMVEPNLWILLAFYDVRARMSLLHRNRWSYGKQINNNIFSAKIFNEKQEYRQIDSIVLVLPNINQ